MSWVLQLHKYNQQYLETNDYMVGPKAGRDCTMLIFQPGGSSFYPINNYLPTKWIEGTYTGPEIDFFLDKEVVFSSTPLQLILKFEVIDLRRYAYQYTQNLH